MEDFKSNQKMQCFKEGGQVKYESRKEHKEEMKSDLGQDKSMVKKGVRQHEVALHKGQPKTELKLKTGGRAKKAQGNVKKFCGGKGVNKYEGGGLIEAIKSGASKLKDNILGTDEQNAVAQANLDKQAGKGSKLAKMLGGKPAQAPSAPENQDQGPFNKKRGGKVC